MSTSSESDQEDRHSNFRVSSPVPSVYACPKIEVPRTIRQVPSHPLLAEILRDPRLSPLPPRTLEESHDSFALNQLSSSLPSASHVTQPRSEDQQRHLRILLHNTTDRLEYEIRRADDAVARAEYAEVLIKERSGAQLSSHQLQQQQCESYRSELDALRKEIDRLRDEKLHAEERASKANRMLQECKTNFLSYQAREQGRQEGLQNGMLKRFNAERENIYQTGYDAGFEEGRSEGFEEGLESGRTEGFHEGREQGRQEERRKAQRAFDKMAQEERHDRDETRSEWMRRWAESVYNNTS